MGQKEPGKANNALLEKEKWREERRKKMVSDSQVVSEKMKLRNGMFHEIVPICVGDPYADPVSVSRSFARSRANVKGGKAHLSESDGCFSPLLTTSCVPSSSVDETKASTTKKNKPFGKDVPPFRSGGKRSERQEDTVYAFTATNRSMTRDQIKQLLRDTKQAQLQKDKERIQRIKERTSGMRPNITTNPVKKGGYGYPNLLLGPVYYHQGPQEKSFGKSNQDDSKPAFCSTTKPTSGIFSRDEEVYIHKPLCYPRDKKMFQAEQGDTSMPNDKQLKHQGPFKTSGSTKKCLYEGYPQYLPFTRPESAKFLRRKEMNDESRSEAWRPNSASQTRPVRSVMLNRNAIKHAIRTNRY